MLGNQSGKSPCKTQRHNHYMRQRNQTIGGCLIFWDKPVARKSSDTCFIQRHLLRWPRMPASATSHWPYFVGHGRMKPKPSRNKGPWKKLCVPYPFHVTWWSCNRKWQTRNHTPYIRKWGEQTQSTKLDRSQASSKNDLVQLNPFCWTYLDSPEIFRGSLKPLPSRATAQRTLWSVCWVRQSCRRLAVERAQ